MPLVGYFLKLGTIGFGGPAALVGYMRRDLVETDGSVDEDTYNLSLALAQVMPGPLAAQTAIAIGYFEHGILGATLVGLAFLLPSLVMVLVLYVAFGGLPWVQSLFDGTGAVVIAIIAMAAYRLARGTNKRNPLLWGIFAVLLGGTVWSGAELAWLFILAGIAVVFLRAWPGGRRAAAIALAALALGAGAWGLETFVLHTGMGGGSLPLQILLFFTKAGAFVFGGGLAIVPFLQRGVVHELGWLTEHQFLDAVAVALITPGPVVITVAFIGYLVYGATGATLAASASSCRSTSSRSSPLRGSSVTGTIRSSGPSCPGRHWRRAARSPARSCCWGRGRSSMFQPRSSRWQNSWRCGVSRCRKPGPRCRGWRRRAGAVASGARLAGHRRRVVSPACSEHYRRVSI